MAMIHLLSIPLLLLIFLQPVNFPQDFICLYRSYKHNLYVEAYNKRIDSIDEALRQDGWLPKEEIEWYEMLKKMDKFEPQERSPWPGDAWKYTHPII